MTSEKDAKEDSSSDSVTSREPGGMKKICRYLSDNKYAVFVLTMLMLAYMVNQLAT